MYIHKFEYSVDINSVVEMNSVVYNFSVVDEDLVVCKSSVKMVDENFVVAQFSSVHYCTPSRN